MLTTSKKHIVNNVLKYNDREDLIAKICTSTWQGVILKARYNDSTLIMNKCFSWLSRWKDCPTENINEIHSNYLQIIPTLSFKKFRGDENIQSNVCRLCKNGMENVKHLLSNCEKFLATNYKRRHDGAIKLVLFKFLRKNNFICLCPPWYSNIQIKPRYEDENITILWDIPEYSGFNDQDENHILRPDGKIILKKEKQIFILEMSVPWIDNRATKFEEKEAKYHRVVQNLKIDNPGYKVNQLTFIMDCLGGHSQDLETNLKALKFDTREIENIVAGMQKVILSEAQTISRQFKILTNK